MTRLLASSLLHQLDSISSRSAFQPIWDQAVSYGHTYTVHGRLLLILGNIICTRHAQ